MQISLFQPPRQTPRPFDRSAAPAVTTWRNPDPAVLLVDDDPAVRESLRRVLIGEGLHVFSASGGDEALRFLELHEPDLLITDLCLASTDGWGILARESRLRPELPIFVITALPPQESGGADKVADEFFQKPLDLDALLAAIRGHLGAPASAHPQS